jgi:hypothetical protein
MVAAIEAAAMADADLIMLHFPVMCVEADRLTADLAMLSNAAVPDNSTDLRGLPGL